MYNVHHGKRFYFLLCGSGTHGITDNLYKILYYNTIIERVFILVCTSILYTHVPYIGIGEVI